MPGTMPRRTSSCGIDVPSSAFCPSVSSNRITPLRNSSAPWVANSSERYARRVSSVD
jgi:hypothetical protein